VPAPRSRPEEIAPWIVREVLANPDEPPHYLAHRLHVPLSIINQVRENAVPEPPDAA
jgi:hypothetical protein